MKRGRSLEQSREAEILRALAGLPREKKRRGPRSVLPVRIPTGSPVLAIQRRGRGGERERERGKKIKGSIFPPSANIRVEQNLDARANSFNGTHTFTNLVEVLFDHSLFSGKQNPLKKKIEKFERDRKSVV